MGGGWGGGGGGGEGGGGGGRGGVEVCLKLGQIQLMVCPYKLCEFVCVCTFLK